MGWTKVSICLFGAAALLLAGAAGMRAGEASAGREAGGPGDTSRPFKLYSPLLANDSAASTPAVTPNATATPTASATAVATPAIPPGVTPFPTQRSTYGNITVTDKSSQAARGGPAFITINTTPNSVCTIKFNSPGGTPSTAEGLGPQTTDSAGNTTWTWRVAGNSTQGVWTVAINCSDASGGGAGGNYTIIVS